MHILIKWGQLLPQKKNEKSLAPEIGVFEKIKKRAFRFFDGLLFFVFLLLLFHVAQKLLKHLVWQIHFVFLGRLLQHNPCFLITSFGQQPPCRLRYEPVVNCLNTTLNHKNASLTTNIAETANPAMREQFAIASSQ
jgi:hypothetical protein